jgi:hypothetical protein
MIIPSPYQYLGAFAVAFAVGFASAATIAGYCALRRGVATGR